MDQLHTSARLRHLNKLQDGVICGIWLIASVCMPTSSDICRPVFPKVLCRARCLVRGDDIDVRVLFGIVLGERVNVQCR